MRYLAYYLREQSDESQKNNDEFKRSVSEVTDSFEAAWAFVNANKGKSGLVALGVLPLAENPGEECAMEDVQSMITKAGMSGHIPGTNVRLVGGSTETLVVGHQTERDGKAFGGKGSGNTA